MTNIDTKSPAFKSICAYVKAVPMRKGGNGRQWRADPAGVALLVQQVLSLDPDAWQIGPLVGKECGFSGQVIAQFCRGLSPSGDVWVDLREHLRRLGVKWLRTKADLVRVDDLSPSSPAPTADAPPPRAAAPAATFIDAPAPRAVAPTVGKITKASTLVVTPDGNVEISDAPVRVRPAVVQAESERAAVRALPRNWRIDKDTQDIIVTTRLIYGTPEHRKKMADIALQLGTASTPTTK